MACFRFFSCPFERYHFCTSAKNNRLNNRFISCMPISNRYQTALRTKKSVSLLFLVSVIVHVLLQLQPLKILRYLFSLSPFCESFPVQLLNQKTGTTSLRTEVWRAVRKKVHRKCQNHKLYSSVQYSNLNLLSSEHEALK